MDLALLPERDLALACGRGELPAWHELLRRYGHRIAAAFHQAGARDDHDDLRQELCTRLLARDAAALRDFRAERPGALPLLLHKVARSVAIDHLRFHGARPLLDGGEEAALELPHDGPSPEQHVREQQQQQRLRRAVAQAAGEAEHPARDLDILRLHFLELYMPTEIAEMGLGLGVRGVESVLRRARARLRELLQDEP